MQLSLQINGSNHKTCAEGYRFAFNGQEKDDEVSGAGNTLTAEFWEYDSRLGRRWNVDPRSDDAVSPYACFRNNPLFYSDEYGDSVNVAGVSSENQMKITTDLVAKTGLQFITMPNGNLDVQRDANGAPIIGKDADGKEIGSKTARGLVLDAITSSKMINVSETQMGVGQADIGSHDISLNFNAIQTLQNNASNEKTKASLSVGMILMHEFYHELTGKGDGWADRNNGNSVWRGPTVRYMNKIEKELGYATRKSYGTTVKFGRTEYRYVSFSQSARLSLIFGKAARRGSYSYYQSK